MLKEKVHKQQDRRAGGQEVLTHHCDVLKQQDCRAGGQEEVLKQQNSGRWAVDRSRSDWSNGGMVQSRVWGV